MSRSPSPGQAQETANSVTGTSFEGKATHEEMEVCATKMIKLPPFWETIQHFGSYK